MVIFHSYVSLPEGIFPRGGIYNGKSVWKLIFGNCSVGGIYNGYIVGYIMENMDDFMMLFTPIEQCSKPLLVDDYKGLYYPIYMGIISVLTVNSGHMDYVVSKHITKTWKPTYISFITLHPTCWKYLFVISFSVNNHYNLLFFKDGNTHGLC